MNWAGAIVDALHESRVLVLVFSTNSNGSQQVMREVERAASSGIPILPFRIENVIPSKGMEFFLGTPHWLDAMTPPLEQHLGRLASTVTLLLEQLPQPVAAPEPGLSPPGPAEASVVSPSVSGSSSVATPEPEPASNSGIDGQAAVAQAGPHAPPAGWLPAWIRASRRSLLDSRFRWPALAVFVLALGTGAAVGVRCATAAPSLTAIQLYNALIASPIAESELPKGFSAKAAPSENNGDLTDSDKQFHAVGEVSFTFTGPDSSNSFSYTIFPSPTEARGSWATYSSALTPSGFKEPAGCSDGTGTSNNQKYGYTRCVALAGDVYIYSQSRLSGDTQDKGNLSSATTLLALGLEHLGRVRSQPPRPLSAEPPATAATSEPSTATATASPGLSSRSGAVLARDDFSDPKSGLFATATSSPSLYSIGYVNGEYQVAKIDPATSGGDTSFTSGTYGDSVVDVDVRLVGPAAGRQVALYCRLDSAGNGGYFLDLDPSKGTVSLARASGVQTVQLVPPEPSSAIKRDNQSNHLRLVCSGGTITGSVNGVQVATAQDTTYQTGRVGLFAGVYNDALPATVDARFRAFLITQP